MEIEYKLYHYMSNDRPKWGEIWMQLAQKIALRSTCKIPERKIGCVIVPDNNEGVLAIGYNGGAAGDDNGSCEYNGSEKVVIGTSRCTCIHAEMNAMIKLNKNHPGGKVMYVTTSPCMLCSKMIINAGIARVVYGDVYSQESIDFLKKMGVRCTLWR